MGLVKPQASKAPAYVMDQAMFNKTVADPCCIPEAVNPLLANGEAMHTNGPDATHHIVAPNTH